jgi:hypothetical protein
MRCRSRQIEARCLVSRKMGDWTSPGSAEVVLDCSRRLSPPIFIMTLSQTGRRTPSRAGRRGKSFLAEPVPTGVPPTNQHAPPPHVSHTYSLVSLHFLSFAALFFGLGPPTLVLPLLAITALISPQARTELLSFRQQRRPHGF